MGRSHRALRCRHQGGCGQSVKEKSRELMSRVLHAIWRALPGMRDLHLYGGALLVLVALVYYDWRIGVGVFGVYLVYLGRPWQ